MVMEMDIRVTFHDIWVWELLMDTNCQVRYRETSVFPSNDYGIEMQFYDQSCEMIDVLSWVYLILQEQHKYDFNGIGSLGVDW